MEPYLGEIHIFAFDLIPNGWAACNGQLMAISQYQALFSLLGTTYGGDGRTTFALPDLRGRVPLHASPAIILGAKAGQSGATLGNNNIPLHTHNIMITNLDANAPAATGNLISKQSETIFSAPQTSMSALAPGMIGNTGNSTPVSNMQPYLGLTVCISLAGEFPSRN